MPFSRRGNVPMSGYRINKCQRPAVLQLNIEGLTASKMNVLHDLAMQYEGLVILLQETHRTCADKLRIPGLALARSSLSRKHGLATFIHDRQKWIFVDQSPTTSETKWLCVDVDGYGIVNVYKPGMWKRKRWKRKRWKRSFFCGSGSTKNPPLPHRREEWRGKKLVLLSFVEERIGEHKH